MHREPLQLKSHMWANKLFWFSDNCRALYKNAKVTSELANPFLLSCLTHTILHTGYPTPGQPPGRVCVLKISWCLFLQVFQGTAAFQGYRDTWYSHSITGNRKLTVLQRTAYSKIFTKEGYKGEKAENVPKLKYISLYWQSKELGGFYGLK